MIEVIHGDSFDYAELFASCDVQLTDFPYSPHVHEKATSYGALTGGMGVHARDLGFNALTPELRILGALAAASVKRWTVVFTDHEGAGAWRDAFDAADVENVRTVPWIRWSQAQLSGDRPCSGSELVLVAHAAGGRTRGGKLKPLKKRWNGPGSLVEFETNETLPKLDRRCMRGQDKHPTEKPIDLMLDLVCYFSDPGETVLDLCAGAATTALACRLLGRSCIAIELDADWARQGASRARARLSLRDRARAQEWCESVLVEASGVPYPKAKDGSDVRTWERAQRRIADVGRVAGAL